MRKLTYGCLVALAAAATSVAQTTQPAQAAPAADSPKAAVRSLVIAMSNGDASAMHELIYANSPVDQKLVAAMTDTAVAIAELNRGMVAKFGAEQAKAAMGDPAEVVRMTIDNLDKAVEKIDGDNAKVSIANSAQGTLAFKRVDGKWKMDISADVAGKSPEQVDQTLVGVNHGIQVFRDLLSDVNAGKFKTAAEAKAAMTQRMSPATGGTTVPAK